MSPSSLAMLTEIGTTEFGAWLDSDFIVEQYMDNSSHSILN